MQNNVTKGKSKKIKTKFKDFETVKKFKYFDETIQCSR